MGNSYNCFNKINGISSLKIYLDGQLETEDPPKSSCKFNPLKLEQNAQIDFDRSLRGMDEQSLESGS